MDGIEKCAKTGEEECMRRGRRRAEEISYNNRRDNELSSYGYARHAMPQSWYARCPLGSYRGKTNCNLIYKTYVLLDSGKLVKELPPFADSGLHQRMIQRSERCASR